MSSVERIIAALGEQVLEVVRKSERRVYIDIAPDAVVDASCLGRDSLFLYDRYPGGMGFARRCMDCIGEILQTIRTVVEECSCEDGCPSCVGAAVPPFAMTDLDSAVRGRIPDKRATKRLLELIVPARAPSA